MNCGTQTLDGVTRKVTLLRAQMKLSHKKAGDLLAAIKSFCGWVNLPANAIQANELRIDSLVEHLALGGCALGIADRTFSNIVSRVKSAIRLAGPKSRLRFTRPRDYSPEWINACAELDRLCSSGYIAPGDRIALSRFIGFLDAQGISPSSVQSAHGDDFLNLHLQNGRGAKASRKAMAAWNRIIVSGRAESLSSVQFGVPSGRQPVNPPWDVYPESLRSEVEQYLAWMQGQDLIPIEQALDITRPANPLIAETQIEFAPRRSASGRPARPKPIGKKHASSLRHAVHQTAGALVRAGRDPESLRSLSDIITVEAFRVSMTDIRMRLTTRGTFDIGTESGTRHLVGQCLISIAKEWLALPSPITDSMLEDLKRIRPAHLGSMSPRRAELLRRFDDPQYRTAWYGSSSRLCDNAEAIRRARGVDRIALADIQTALTAEIVQSMPVRPGNLASIRFKGDPQFRNLHLPRRRRDPVFLCWSAHEVKNFEQLKARLSERGVEILRLYLEHYWEAALRLNGIADSDFLFPSTDPARSKSGVQLNRMFKKRMAFLGLKMTLHLARHLAAKIVLDRDPNLLVVVSRLLGHKSIETTRAFYCENRTEAASARYQEMITEDAQQLAKEAALAASRIRLRPGARNVVKGRPTASKIKRQGRGLPLPLAELSASDALALTQALISSRAIRK